MCLRRTAIFSGMTILALFTARAATQGDDWGEAGSTVRPGRWWPDLPEVGSSITPSHPIPEAPEAGSTIRPGRWWPELPEAGSQIRPGRPEVAPPPARWDPPARDCCCSARSETSVDPRPSTSGGWDEQPRVGGGVDIPDEAAMIAPGRLVLEDRRTGLAHLFGYLLTFGVGAAVAVAAARTASRSDRDGRGGSKEFVLVTDLVQHMDAFVSAAHQEDLSRCRTALDAIHAQTGQRLLLLSQETNEAVLGFLAVAVNCWAATRREEFLRSLGEKYRTVCEALRRELGRDEPLSSRLRQSLENPEQSYRAVR